LSQTLPPLGAAQAPHRSTVRAFCYYYAVCASSILENYLPMFCFRRGTLALDTLILFVFALPKFFVLYCGAYPFMLLRCRLYALARGIGTQLINARSLVYVFLACFCSCIGSSKGILRAKSPSGKARLALSHYYICCGVQLMCWKGWMRVKFR
jgi:hypothetical protein